MDVLRSKCDSLRVFVLSFPGARGRRKGLGEGQLGLRDVTTEELEVEFNRLRLRPSDPQHICTMV